MSQTEGGGGKKFRGWVFTLNNPPRVELPQDWVDLAMFCVWQLEKGEEGTRHLQGYVLFTNAVRFQTVKKLSREAHWEPRRGTHCEAKDYCSKLDTRLDGPFTFGHEPVGQGKRTDLEGVKKRIDDGASVEELWETNFSELVKFGRGIREYIMLKSKSRSTKTKVHILYGTTGCGKSHAARLEAGPDAYWRWQGNSEWWDGYTGQSHVVIDEFYGWIKWSQLLRVCDEYPLRVEIKGGTVSFVATAVWITSNKAPDAWYSYERGMEYETLLRRLTTIRTRNGQSEEWTYLLGDAGLLGSGLRSSGVETPVGQPIIPAHICDTTTCCASTYKPSVVDLTQ